jgi:hypothetical protein
MSPQRLVLLALVVPALTIGTTSVARAEVTENVKVPVVFHITFNANGSITAFVDRLSVDCR